MQSPNNKPLKKKSPWDSFLCVLFSGLVKYYFNKYSKNAPRTTSCGFLSSPRFGRIISAMSLMLVVPFTCAARCSSTGLPWVLKVWFVGMGRCGNTIHAGGFISA